MPPREEAEKLLSIDSCSRCGKALPGLVLVRVSIVTYSADNKGLHVIHNASSLHFEAKHPQLLLQPVPRFAVLHHLVV